MRKERGTADSAGIVARVRSAVAAEDLSGGERLLRNYRENHGVTAETLEALSWLARGAIAVRRFTKAEDFAREVHRSVVRRLKSVEMDSEPSLSSALGAAIEVIAQLQAQQGRRSQAVRFLKRETTEYGLTSIGMRIRKNLNLLTLEGQPAPGLENREWLGPKSPALSKLHGRPVLLFFWAHYCEDSRAQGRVLGRIRERFERDGLALIGPTRRYGYLDEHSRKPVLRRQETAHIQAVLNRDYSELSGMPVPISRRNFDIYGASTTPTLVLTDSMGIVSVYHPGKMPYRELVSQIQRVLA